MEPVMQVTEDARFLERLRRPCKHDWTASGKSFTRATGWSCNGDTIIYTLSRERIQESKKLLMKQRSREFANRIEWAQCAHSGQSMAKDLVIKRTSADAESRSGLLFVAVSGS